MKEIKIRYSKQRELIFNNLKNRYDHPTAEMIYQDLKIDYPHLSLGTVYRNLNQLVETKQIKKLDLGDTMVHYDGNIQPHMHFMCVTVVKPFMILITMMKKSSNNLNKLINIISMLLISICLASVKVA